MTGKVNLIEQAIRQVTTEHSLVTEECEAFKQFREAVRTVSPTDQDGTSAASTRLVSRYKNTVMATGDYSRAYDETVSESLEEELSSSIADVLVMGQPFTHRHKRKTLRLTTKAIDRRTDFIDVLEAERDSLEEALAELRTLQSKADNLPACSPRSLSIDELERTWDAYSDLEGRCRTALKDRQRQIRSAQQSTMGVKSHALNAYLYYELETNYPVLVALSRFCAELPTAELATFSPDTQSESQVG